MTSQSDIRCRPLATGFSAGGSRIKPRSLASTQHRGYPLEDSLVITPADQALLRRAIAIAAHAITLGDAPYGSLLADADGTVLTEAHNTVQSDNDISAHPELKLARWAARELDRDAAARATMYTSCQPCGMCAGGIVRSGLGRVVYAVSSEQFSGLNLEPDWPAVPQEGPALFEEARIPLEKYYRPDER
jgi:tRNA(Arg) A34 adenosine deaminase TadA